MNPSIYSSEMREEAQELFRRARSVPDLLQQLRSIRDTQHLQALTQCLIDYWREQEMLCDERTGYYTQDGQWMPLWPNIEDTLQTLCNNLTHTKETKNTISTAKHTANLTTTQKKNQKLTPKMYKTMKNKNTKATMHITNHFHAPIANYVEHIDHQSLHFDQNMTAQPIPTQPVETKEKNSTIPVVAYSTYLLRNQQLGKSDDEVQTNLQEAAHNGPTALARYLCSAEAKVYFDFRGETKKQILQTLNQELKTQIKEKAFYTALSRNGLRL